MSKLTKLLFLISVFAILMTALVEPTKENDDIGLASLLDSLGCKFGCTTGFVKAATYGNTVITLNGIAYIATCKVDLGISKSFNNAIEWQNLVLHLERRRASTYGHHLNGILAYHQDALRLLQREYLFILQQYDTLLCNFQSGLVVAI